MKTYFHFILPIALIILILGQSCSKEELVDRLVVTIDKSIVPANGFDEVCITVKNQNGEDFTSRCMIYVNDKSIKGNLLITDKPGTYEIRALKGNSVSDTAFVEATNPGPSSFTHKILCEDYTGAWCGHCPRVGIQLDNYVSNLNPNCIFIGIHNGDPFRYTYESQLRSKFDVQGFPTVIVNRNYVWNESDAILTSETNKRAILGLALETSIEGNNILVKAKVKSDITTTLPMKLVVVLVESNLIYPQTNYDYYGLPNPVNDYNHKNVLRKAATDIFGDDIPTTAIVEDTEWSKDFTFNTSGYAIDNCKVIAFVAYSPGNVSRVGVLNVQQIKAGENKAYD